MDDFDTLPKMAGWHETKLAAPVEQMIPTTKFRFVERTQPDYPDANTGRVVRILQQWWASTIKVASGEWRDIPLEQENT